MQEKVEALTAEVTGLRGKKGRKRAVVLIPYADELKNLEKKFAIMEEPWLKPTIFREPLVISASASPTVRFIDDKSYDQGTIAVLHEFVPASLHADMVNLSEFGKEVNVAFVLYEAMCIHHTFTTLSSVGMSTTRDQLQFMV